MFKGFLNDRELHLNYDCVLHLKEPSMKSVLPYFTSAEVVLIDDDMMLLNRIKGNLSVTHCRVKDFGHPKKALEYLNQSLQDSDNLSPVKLENLHHQIYSPERFKQISTVIVDYDMPGMNGLEMCRQITSPHIQKIMLTGAATTDIAVDAFNEGIIDQFIQKNDPDVFAKLQNAVISAQEKYFESNTLELMHQLQNEYPEVSILQDPAFVELFGTITREHKVVEYYLLDPIGNFLFLSETGKSSALFVFNEELLNVQEDMIRESDRNTELAQEVYSKKQAICFYPFSNQEKYEPANWKSYLQPLKRLESESTVFYAYVTDLINLDQSRIISFKDYFSKSEK